MTREEEIEAEVRTMDTVMGDEKIAKIQEGVRYLLEKVERLERQYVVPPFDLSHLGMSALVELRAASDDRYADLKKQEYYEVYPEKRPKPDR